MGENLGCTSIGIRGLGCIIMLLFLGCCFLTLYVIINKPVTLWNPAVDILNNGFVYPNYQKQLSTTIESEIISQIKTVGENDVYISNDQLTYLLQEKLPQFNDLVFKSEDGVLKAYWKLDQGEKPIFGEADIQVFDKNNLVITRLGTPAVKFPSVMYPAINNLLAIFLNQDLVKKQFENFKLNDNLRIDEVSFLKDRVYLSVNVDVKIF